MSLDFWFWTAQAIAFAGWAALLALPRRRELAVRIARLCAALVALGYLIIFALNPEGLKALAEDYSVAGISSLFQDPDIALLGWVHYLAFDLWIGSWETEEAERLAMPHRLLVAPLLLTCALGPLGLLLFLAVARFRRARRSPA